MIALLVVFFSGAAVEAAAVGWCHFSEKGRAGPTAFCSMLMAAGHLIGTVETISDWRMAAVFVLGYGAGSFVAVTFKRYRVNRTITSVSKSGATT